MRSAAKNARGLVSQSATGRCLRMVIIPAMLIALTAAIETTRAGSATWDVNPTSNDWNTPSNWTPQTVPNGQMDVATFDFSTVTGISVASPIVVDSIVFTRPRAPTRSRSVKTIRWATLVCMEAGWSTTRDGRKILALLAIYTLPERRVPAPTSSIQTKTRAIRFILA
jgi:hypothetical protein